MNLENWLKKEPFTLTMSSGFFGFFCHCGMLSALSEAEITPAKVTGASSGALVGACFAAGLPPNDIENELLSLEKAHFWDPGWGRGFLKGEKFRNKLKQMVSVKQIQECPIPLALSTYSLAVKDTVVFTEGLFEQIVYASCALPFLFQPIKINNTHYSDGGIKDRPGLAGTASGERVFYHHISSRSPWRRKNSPALKIPQRDNMIALSLEDIPRSGPNKLHLGEEIFQIAKRKTQQALRQEISEPIIEI